jgi:hypothetical protein
MVEAVILPDPVDDVKVPRASDCTWARKSLFEMR